MKVGLVGAGFIGAVHADIYGRLAKASLSAVLETDEARAQAVQNRAKCPVYGDTDSFFRLGEMDEVDICLPTHLHEEAILRCLQERKHVEGAGTMSLLGGRVVVPARSATARRRQRVWL